MHFSRRVGECRSFSIPDVRILHKGGGCVQMLFCAFFNCFYGTLTYSYLFMPGWCHSLTVMVWVYDWMR